MSTIEGNKLIAEFMGWVYFGHNDLRLVIDKTVYAAGWKRKSTAHAYGKGIFKQYLCRNHSQLRYHCSWDWLKPVIDQIFTYGLAYPEQVKIIRNISIVVGIKPCWEKVVQFIQWYNTKNFKK